MGKKYDKPIRDVFIHHYYGVRKGNWKLIFDLESIDSVTINTIKAEELYNLKDDLAESNNLIVKPLNFWMINHPGD